MVRVSRRVGSEGCPKTGTKTSPRSRETGSEHRRPQRGHTGSRVPENNRAVPKPTDSLASNDFAYCLTLSPKCFSSFPHGTCSLSVSRQYLALDGYHHPLHAPFPRNATRRHTEIAAPERRTYGAVTLYDLDFHRITRHPALFRSQDYNSKPPREGRIMD